MELILERKVHNATSTEGNIWMLEDGKWKWFCHTIEDRVRAKPGEWSRDKKVYAETAIPYGRYPVQVTWSNRFKRLMTGIFNVPDFEGIRIHNGTSEKSSAGCVIVSYVNDDGPEHDKNRVVNDKKAMNDLCDMVYKKQHTEKVWIEIVDRKEDASCWA